MELKEINVTHLLHRRQQDLVKLNGSDYNSKKKKFVLSGSFHFPVCIQTRKIHALRDQFHPMCVKETRKNNCLLDGIV